LNAAFVGSPAWMLGSIFAVMEDGLGFAKSPPWMAGFAVAGRDAG
jgi:hypothetical protein